MLPELAPRPGARSTRARRSSWSSGRARASWPAPTPSSARCATRPTSSPSPGRRSARRGRRARVLRPRRGRCGWSGWSRRSRRCRPPRGCSAGRSRRCATTSLARAPRAGREGAGGGAGRAGRGASTRSWRRRERAAAPRRSRGRCGRGRRRPRRPDAGGPAAARARELKPALARQSRADDEAAADRARAQLAAAQRDALAHADQPLPAAGEPVGGGAVGDVVGDLDLEHLRRPAQDDPRPAAAAVLERVGQALLHERKAVRSTPGASGAGSALDAQLHVEPGVARARDEGAEALERGCGEWSASWPSGRRMPSGGASRSAPRDRSASTRAQRADRGVGVAVEHAARRAGLHDHDRDRVRDDVVQLARDPHALARHRVALALAALALELLGARRRARRSGARGRGRRAPAPSSRAKSTTGKTTSPTVWSGPSAVTTTTSARTPPRPARARRRGRCAPIAKDRTATRIEVEARSSGGVSASARATADCADRAQRRQRRRAAPGHRQRSGRATQQRAGAAACGAPTDAPARPR